MCHSCALLIHVNDSSVFLYIKGLRSSKRVIKPMAFLCSQAYSLLAEASTTSYRVDLQFVKVAQSFCETSAFRLPTDVEQM